MTQPTPSPSNPEGAPGSTPHPPSSSPAGPSSPHPAAAPPPDPAFKRNQWLLALAQLFAGIGIASGIAVGGLLAEDLTGKTAFAGFSQTASILGAGLAAVPLARLAAARSRAFALTSGLAIAGVGAVIVTLASVLVQPVLFFIGMLLFGSATAAGLQARYAATDAAPKHLSGRAMSFVVWATTVGSVAGPNLSEPGAELGKRLGMHPLVGPFVISIAVFVIAALFTRFLKAPRLPATSKQQTGTRHSAAEAPAASQHPTTRTSRDESPTPASGKAPAHPDPTSRDESPTPTSGKASTPGKSPATPAHESGLRAGLRAAAAHPAALMGLATVVAGHMMMVSVMVMTPVHMHHHGLELHLVGIVISLHILGMYGLSPLYGWLTDRWGAVPVIVVGQVIFLISIVLGVIDALRGSDMVLISIALTLLGLGWSATLIGGSTLLSQSVEEDKRVAIQGTTDAFMNFGAAGLAALAGPLLAVGGFVWINICAAIVLMALVGVCMWARYGKKN